MVHFRLTIPHVVQLVVRPRDANVAARVAAHEAEACGLVGELERLEVLELHVVAALEQRRQRHAVALALRRLVHDYHPLMVDETGGVQPEMLAQHADEARPESLHDIHDLPAGLGLCDNMVMEAAGVCELAFVPEGAVVASLEADDPPIVVPGDFLRHRFGVSIRQSGVGPPRGPDEVLVGAVPRKPVLGQHFLHLGVPSQLVTVRPSPSLQCYCPAM